MRYGSADMGLIRILAAFQVVAAAMRQIRPATLARASADGEVCVLAHTIGFWLRRQPAGGIIGLRC
jgi:hypothetical protein